MSSTKNEVSGIRGEGDGVELVEIRVLPADETGTTRTPSDLSTVNAGPQQVS